MKAKYSQRERDDSLLPQIHWLMKNGGRFEEMRKDDSFDRIDSMLDELHKNDGYGN